MKTKSFLALLLAGFVAFGACTPPSTDNGEDTEKPEPKPEPDPSLHKVTFPFYEDYPVNCGNLIVEGTDAGVSIEVIKVEDNNFAFELRPGATVQSFKFDVYPMASLYNILLNKHTSGELELGDEVAVNEAIRRLLFNQEGSGGYAISVDSFEDPEDFLQITMDWMSTDYAPASAIAVPDCGFLIAVVASSDVDINSENQADLTLCYVHTSSQALLGDPGCEISVTTGYEAFKVQHILNSDAAGIYYFGGLADEIDAYIDAFGDTMFRDFVRTLYSYPSTPDKPETLTYTTVYPAVDANGNPVSYHEIQSATVAVAVDKNLTPQEGYTRKDFSLPERPDVEDTTMPSVAVLENRVAAAYFEFNVELPKEYDSFYYDIYTEQERAALLEGSSADRKIEANRLVKEGWGITNINFRWDKTKPDGEKAVGSSCRMLEQVYGDKDLVPGTTVYLGYTARTGYFTTAGNNEIIFSEPIQLDERNLTSPDECKVKDLKLTLDEASRSSFRQNVTYDPSTVSLIYFQYMTEDNKPEGLELDSPWKDWVEFIIADAAKVEYGNMNVWATTESGSDPWVWTGMNPGVKYTVFLCAEDFDGNMSKMHFATVETKEVQVGPDPTVTLAMSKNSNPAEGDWKVTFKIDHDVKNYYYCGTGDYADLTATMPGLTKSQFNNIAESDISYDEWVEGIYEWVALGFENNGGGMETNYDSVSLDWKGDDTYIAACIAVGEDEDGTPVYKLYHLICKDGEAQTLEQIFEIE